MRVNTCSQSHRPIRRSIGFRDRIREVLCDLRQLRYPPEFRIAPRPIMASATHPEPVAAPTAGLAATASAERQEQDARLDRSIAKVAVCVWDIRRKLEGSEIAQQDRKLRLLNRRAEAAVMALEDAGVLIDDPIGRRYVAGSEAAMKPHFEPTAGTVTEQIVQTVSPVVYRDDRLIGQGEVFVAIPDPAHGTASGRATAEPAQTADRGCDAAATVPVTGDDSPADAGGPTPPTDPGDLTADADPGHRPD
jgi:hypothetical protein